MELRDRRVTIMGLGLHGGGVAAARYCAQAGANVTVTDLADERALGASLAQLPNIPISNFKLGGHREDDFHYADVVVVNPAVRPGNKFVELARRGGARIASEIELFLDACPARVIGVTGTVGKSTTASMLAAILQRADRRVWLGGNIGHSLLADLPNIKPDHTVVLELSSFQLQWLSETVRWPWGAIITNCTPNHLDWHGSRENYAAAKRRLAARLPSDGVCVANLDDREVLAWRASCAARWVDDRIENVPPLGTSGEHNRTNAELTARMAVALGVPHGAILRALQAFKGLRHRLEFVAAESGRAFYNDSKSTSPAATLAALKSMDRPTWVLIGGVDANADFGELIERLPKLVKGAAVFGAVAAKLAGQIGRRHPQFRCEAVGTMADALAWCIANSKLKDVILLSPGCPSTDEFRDFAQRGETFEGLVRQWCESSER